MKKIITLAAIAVALAQVHAQNLKDLGNKLGKQAKEKVQAKIAAGSDKPKVSKEFSQGNIMLYAENMSAGKGFPAGMMTTSSAQIVQINGKNWLEMGGEGSFTFKNLIPDSLVKKGILKDKNLPENCTFEFDILATKDFVYRTKELATVFASAKNLKTDMRKWGENRYEGTGVKVGVHPIEFGDKDKGQTRMMLYANGKETQKTEKAQRSFTIDKNTAKVQFMRNGTRLRVFINGEKAWDVQDAFDEKVKYNAILFTTGAFEGDNKFYISNIKLTTELLIEPK